MPKYVAKEDVDKGLVDPLKPLEEQPEYEKYLNKQNEGKEPKQKDSTKGDKKFKSKREKDERPQYNWNRRDITLETKAPAAPKKLLPKPDKEAFRKQMDIFKKEREELFQKRKHLIEEQRILIKNNNDGRKSGKMILSKYSGILKEKSQAKKSIDNEIKDFEDKKEQLQNEMDILKAKIKKYKRPDTLADTSAEELRYRAEQKQTKLATADLNKKEQAKLHNEIQEIKRAQANAKSEMEINIIVGKFEDELDILYHQFKQIRTEISHCYKKLKPIKAELAGIWDEKKAEEGQMTEIRSYEEIKTDYDKKITKIDAQREEISKKMDDLRDKYNLEMDKYEDQQDLLKYIEYVEDEKEYKTKKQDEELKKKKEKEVYEAKQKKEYEERLKKREERQKKDEERQKEIEEKKIKLEKDREQYINRNPNAESISLCKFLIEYCQRLKPNKTEKAEDNEVNKQVVIEGSQWANSEIIQSKKSKADQEPKKKDKKKKKEVKPEDEEFRHAIDIINRFQDQNLLPPSNLIEIDDTISELESKLNIYENPTEESVQEYRERAGQDFDRKNGLTEVKYRNKEENHFKNPEDKKPTKKKYREVEPTEFPNIQNV